MSNPETIREEKLKTTKSLLIDMSKKIDRVYNKLMNIYIYVGQNVEKGYWGVYERLESVRKEIKDALNELDATLDELKYVNAPSLDETAEINTEIKDEKQLIGNVYDVFNELATIYDKDVLFILTYTLEAKFFDIYSKIEYSIRRALWNAIMLLADIIYNFSTR
jgi:vacuolar-type H+-ATPase subunit I/STV1